MRDAPATHRLDLMSTFTPEVLARFDLIGIDPRGVGASTPAIDCGDTQVYQTIDYSPDDAVERAALQQGMRSFAAACRERNGPILDFLDSHSMARDMDQIRIALGEEKISYYGDSYGTVLGTAYAYLFPERVRAFVLDSAIRPSLDGIAYLRERGQASERAFDAFATDCDSRPDCAARFGGDLRAAFDRGVQQLEAAPLVDPTSRASATEGQFVSFVGGQLAFLDGSGAGTMVNPQAGNLILGAIEEANAGRAVVLPDMFKVLGPADLRTVALVCADLGFPDPGVVYGQILPELLAAAPRFGQAWLRYALPCAHWPPRSRQHSLPQARGAPPILVVGATGDPTTPYWWSQQLAGELNSGVLLTREGVGHVRFNPCTTDAMSAHLLELTVPAPGTSCPTQ
jgi:pimeloyl-ACP methyl ester carboxylesterase